ncbi:crossover junction endodeoxyribonuclease RuvC [Desulfovibrionales bacterium]
MSKYPYGMVVVLGLDPGFRATGYGVILEQSGQIEYLDAGVIRTDSGASLVERLGAIYVGVVGLVERYAPHEAVVENIFAAKNVASALKLGQARGAAISALAVTGLPISEYEPTLVKQSVVGVGRADKEQVAFMVGRILVRDLHWAKDASDALAIAICHLNHRRCRHLLA